MGVIFKRQLIAEVIEDLAPPPDREAVREAAEFGVDRRGWVLMVVQAAAFCVSVLIAVVLAGWLRSALDAKGGREFFVVLLVLWYWPVSKLIGIGRAVVTRRVVEGAIRAETRAGS